MRGQQQMIGELRFNVGDRRVQARLTEDLVWQSDDKAIETFLNRTCPVDQYEPAVGRRGVHDLYQAGHRLGAEIHRTRS